MRQNKNNRQKQKTISGSVRWSGCRNFSIFSIILCVLTTALFVGRLNAGPAEKAIRLKSIHPEWRNAAAPAGGKEVAVNPPSLIWPAGSSDSVRFCVRLSQNSSFPENDTISAEDLSWAMFNPHRKLETGKWYWQYAVKEQARPLRWSKISTFEVTENARIFVTPSPEQMFAAVPDSHPRILATAEQIPELRRNATKLPDFESILKRAEKSFDVELKNLSNITPDIDVKSLSKQDAKTVLSRAQSAYANKLRDSIEYLCMAYLASGEEKFAQQAVKYALHIASWDSAQAGEKDRFISDSDFAAGACMTGTTFAYDTCYNFLSEEQKQILRHSIKLHASRFYRNFLNSLESRLLSNHPWQITLREFTYAAFATLGEIPESATWAEYVYELWLARVPLQGGDDGGWANGNGYFPVNFITLIYMPELFGKLTNVNFFSHPWYRNSIYFLIYTMPPQSRSAGFGDMHDKRKKPGVNLMAYVDTIGREFNEPAAFWYVHECKKGSDIKITNDKTLKWHRIRSGIKDWADCPEQAPALPQARLFRDIGVAAMHTNLTRPSENLMLAFRSSPYGCFGHMHANQNAFNILYGGRPVFYTSGYYTGFSDKHNLLCYRHTRGHNSILIDGIGQTLGTEGYGWIPRYLHGEQITYCLGDASGAYGDIVSDFWLQRMEKSGVENTKQNGFGDPALQHFRRHIVMLRPSTIVVYDELKARKPVEWSWLLQSLDEMTQDKQKKSFEMTTENARSQVNIYGSDELELSVSDKFFYPAYNWLKKHWMNEIADEQGKLPDRWHAAVKSAGKTSAIRYLAIIQVRDIKQQAPFDEPVVDENGWYNIGNWQIKAQLNPAKDASLQIRKLDGTAALTTDKEGSVTVAGKQYNRLQPGSTLLVEKTDTGVIVKEAVDQLPEAAK